MSSHERRPLLCAESRGALVSSVRLKPARSNTKPCKALGNSSSTGGGATVTRRLAAPVGPRFSSPKERPRSCPKPNESKARCRCEKWIPPTSRTPVPKSIEAPPGRERSRDAAWQPLRPLPASVLRQVQRPQERSGGVISRARFVCRACFNGKSFKSVSAGRANARMLLSSTSSSGEGGEGPVSSRFREQPPPHRSPHSLLCGPPAGHADYFCLASQLSKCAISFFCATLICLAMAFISADLPFTSSISAIFKAC